MMQWLAALALLVQSPAELAGTYRTQQMEVGATLELNADGTFRYALDYGAVSEAAEGRWTVEDGAVRLDSDPMAASLLGEIERSDAEFNDQQLMLDDGALILQRHDTLFAFHRDGQ
jgi:hypothetical protein